MCVPSKVGGVSILLIATLFLAGCDRLPETYAPPEQRHPLLGGSPPSESMLVEMGDPEADLRIVRDIYGASNPSWRWTGQNPAIRMLLFRTENVKFLADFAIWDQGFKTTGPVEITYLVNNQVLEKIRYTTPGVKHYEKAIPPDWLSVDSETTLALSVDKVYVKDGMKYGVILVRLGLKP
jgi:hypothetical protein